MYTWKRYGGYEVSSRGDRRFSAFNAMLEGRSIECWYQCDVKGYDPGGSNWRAGKGKPPLDRETDTWKEYLALWIRWAHENPELIAELKVAADAHGNVLSDRFANSQVNQARALAQVLNGW